VTRVKVEGNLASRSFTDFAPVGDCKRRGTPIAERRFLFRRTIFGIFESLIGAVKVPSKANPPKGGDAKPPV
jgi:hypothetical protein